MLLLMAENDLEQNLATGAINYGGCDYGECDYCGFYGGCEHDKCDYGGCVSVRVWPMG